MKFRPMPKTPRLSREIVISEKIDGTNASVYIPPPEEAHLFARKVLAGSRTRWIEPGDDNFGFAAWVEKNWEELLQLGPGHHFGEWWGKGIQRGYGIEQRRFSLFNVSRWLVGEAHDERIVCCPPCCDVVPVLYRGPFGADPVESSLNHLRCFGSQAAPGFLDPEGIMVYHTAANQLFKKTLKGDEEGKHAEAHPKKEKPPKAPRDPSKGGRRLIQHRIDFPDRRRA
jgi:hypothetical protein